MYQRTDTEKSATELAIILVAGAGNRLGREITQGSPKCLVKVCGQTLLEWQLQALSNAGVRRVVLVVGHSAHKVHAEAARLAEKHRLFVSFVKNELYAASNTLYSLYLAREYLSEACYCLNGDVLFPGGLLPGLAKRDGGATLLVDVHPCGAEEVKILAGEDGRIHNIGKEVDPGQCQGEFVGIAHYPKGVGRAFAGALTTRIETHNAHTAYYERALADIAKEVPLFALSTQGEPMIEIDFPADFHRAVHDIAPRLSKTATQPKR